MRVSVIVSTYNRPRALARVLTALSDQTCAAHEVIVADDGSRAETAELVAQYQTSFPVPLKHVWQADEGFRLSAVRNLAASKATGDWLHFLDGDCVPQTTLIERTTRLAEPGWMLAGDRVLVSQTLTEQIEHTGASIHRWSFMQWFAHRMGGRVNRLLPLAHWPGKAGRGYRQDDWRHFRTANVGLMRDAFMRVNGFEAAMEGWGLDDSEFAVRAINAGLKVRSARLALGVFHLWHREQSREDFGKNQLVLDESIRSGRTRAQRGVDEYLP